MRKKIVAGNWKMNKTLEEGVKLVEETLQLFTAQPTDNAIMIFCPPFISLEKISLMVDGKSNVFTAAQNCYSEKSGAYTGEVSVSMIKSVGAQYVILGHSERRQYFDETNEMLARKTNLVLEEGLNPIFCVGELLEVREGNKQEELVGKQISEGLFHLSAEELQKVVIAYEPVWAIGTGKVATDEQAQEMHAFIRKILAAKYNAEVANEISILYGGSCKPSNAAGFFSQKDIDGGLIGGASLVATDFVGIINKFQ
ncbi:MAG: triose-phosphate isomerase [Chitinophagales bacterium]|nr:triose-phosphate isomerase [Chitinophagales bacterium]